LSLTKKIKEMNTYNKTKEILKWSSLFTLAGGIVCLFAKNKQLKNVGMAATILGATSFLASCNQQRRGVRINTKHLDILKLGLHPNENQFIRLNDEGYIDDILINQAKNKINIGINFNSLLELVNSSETIEIYINKKIEFRNRNNVTNYEYFPTQTKREHPLDAVWLSEGGSPDFKGKSNANRTYQEMVQYYLKRDGETNDPIYFGVMGVTLYPINYNSDKYVQFSTNNNIQIFINENAPVLDQVITLTHEAYGHALFKIRNLNHSHGTSRIIGVEGCNDLLEKQIYECRVEAEQNYEKYI